MKFIKTFENFKLNEGIKGQSDYKEGDIVLIRYEITKGDPIITPVKIVKIFTKNAYLVSHKIEESQLKNFPDLKIRYSQIIAPFKTADDSGTVINPTENPRLNPNVGGLTPGATGHPTNDITQLPANQNPSNDLAL